jgi:predicted transglutaminase-like cysteine proteinase
VDVRSFFVSGPSRTFLVENFRLKMLPLSIAEDAIEWDKALACQAWVSKNIRFVPDDRECWQMPSETASLLVGDCEDGAILLANMLLALGLEPEKVKVVCGSLSSGVGHCVVEFDGVQLDWLHLARIEKVWFKFSETKVELCST